MEIREESFSHTRVGGPDLFEGEMGLRNFPEFEGFLCAILEFCSIFWARFQTFALMFSTSLQEMWLLLLESFDYELDH